MQVLSGVSRRYVVTIEFVSLVRGEQTSFDATDYAFISLQPTGIRGPVEYSTDDGASWLGVPMRAGGPKIEGGAAILIRSMQGDAQIGVELWAADGLVDEAGAAVESGEGGAGGVAVQDEGVAVGVTATTLNFVGDGVAVTGSGATKTVTIAGAEEPTPFELTVGEDGAPVGDAATALNFTGDGVTVTGAGATKTIDIPGGGGGGGGTPAGSDTQVQFNDDGAFGGATGLTVDAGTGALRSAAGVLLGTVGVTLTAEDTRHARLRAADVAADYAGTASIVGGDRTDVEAVGASVAVTGGNPTGGGGIVALAGNGVVAGGYVIFEGGASGEGDGGGMGFFAGSGVTAGGPIELAAGMASAGAGGDLILSAGGSTGGDPGRVLINGGFRTDTGVPGGTVFIDGGASLDAGGDVYLNGGSHDTGPAGYARINGGIAQGEFQDGGKVIIGGGDAPEGVAGNVEIHGGFGSLSRGGVQLLVGDQLAFSCAPTGAETIAIGFHGLVGEQATDAAITDFATLKAYLQTIGLIGLP